MQTRYIVLDGQRCYICENERTAELVATDQSAHDDMKTRMVVIQEEQIAVREYENRALISSMNFPLV